MDRSDLPHNESDLSDQSDSISGLFIPNIAQVRLLRTTSKRSHADPLIYTEFLLQSRFFRLPWLPPL